MELKPTKGCLEAIACLEKHCKLLKGSTNKEVLEVFYQEVGIRLDGYVSLRCHHRRGLSEAGTGSSKSTSNVRSFRCRAASK